MNHPSALQSLSPSQFAALPQSQLPMSELNQEMLSLLYERVLALLRNPASLLRDIKVLVDLIHKSENLEIRARQLTLAETRRPGKRASGPNPSPEPTASTAATQDSIPENQSDSQKNRVVQIQHQQQQTEKKNHSDRLPVTPPQPARGVDVAETDPERFMNREERRRHRKHLAKAR